MIYRVLLLLGSVLLVTGCSASSMAKMAYPDREMHSFADEDGDTKTYLCAPGPDAKDRAKKANEYLTNAIDAFAHKEVEELLAKDEVKYSDTFKTARRTQAAGEQLGEEIETRYQCLLIETE